MGVSLNWGGFNKALKRAAAKDTSSLLEELAESMVSGTLQRFSDEESPDGEAWKKSSRAEAEDGKTLQDTGRLRASIDYAVTNDAVKVGSNVAYARIHQLRGKTGRGRKVNMPARPYLGFSSEDRKEAQAILQDHLKNMFR